MSRTETREPKIYRNPDGTEVQLPGGSAVGEGTWIDSSVRAEGPVVINASSDADPNDPTIVEADVLLARSVYIGKGVLISAGCQLGVGTQIES